MTTEAEVSDLAERIARQIMKEMPYPAGTEISFAAQRAGQRIVTDLRLETESCPVGDGHRVFGHADKNELL